jgi:hypothetical protein
VPPAVDLQRPVSEPQATPTCAPDPDLDAEGHARGARGVEHRWHGGEDAVEDE